MKNKKLLYTSLAILCLILIAYGAKEMFYNWEGLYEPAKILANPTKEN